MATASAAWPGALLPARSSSIGCRRGPAQDPVASIEGGGGRWSRRGARRRATLAPGAACLLLALAGVLLILGHGPRAFLAASRASHAAAGSGPSATAGGRATVLRRAAEAVEAEPVEPVVEGEGALALTKLETAIEAQIAEAQAGENPDRLRDLARLLVLAKTAEGLAVVEMSAGASDNMKKAIADSLAGFVGKDDYDFKDVTQEVKKRCASAVTALDDVYFEDIAREMDLAGQAAIASFTGKEEYKFGDVAKEVDRRAKDAVSAFTGKEDYKFGDISKEALKQGGDAIKGFTGKEEYKFGDITKTALKKIFGNDDK